MTFRPIETSLIVQQFPQIGSMDLIDSGGFKGVYRADVQGKTEAVKVIGLDNPPVPNAEEILKEQVGRVRREVNVLTQCAVPELVKLGSIPLTQFRIGNDHFLIYSEEYLNGPDLAKLIQGSLDKPGEGELRQLFLTLLKAIKALWSRGFIHRDIKPKNVIKLTDPQRPFVLLDLGIAFGINETALTFQAHERLPLATYRYIAPEMLQPNFRDNLDYRSDLYTAAMTVFEYGAKQHPLARDQDDLLKTFSRAMRQMPTPLHSLRPDVDIAFCGLIDQMLKKNPALRPGNLNNLIALIEKGMKQ